MKSPFDYCKSINFKQYDTDLSGYNPYLTNRAFAFHMDTVMFAEAMNQAFDLPPLLQYDFYYHAVRKGKRFGFPKKHEEYDKLLVVMEYFQYSKQKATETIRLLSSADIEKMQASMDKGGQ